MSKETSAAYDLQGSQISEAMSGDKESPEDAGVDPREPRKMRCPGKPGCEDVDLDLRLTL